MIQGIGQDSSRTWRFEVEDEDVSMIPICGSAARSWLFEFFRSISPALFVRDEPAAVLDEVLQQREGFGVEKNRLLG